MPMRNDEPTVADHLNHTPLAQQIADVLDDCDCPFVLGISGGWGSGKTSFLLKLKDQLERNNKGKIDKRDGIHLVWFNPWHHQFESTPLVALLHEIRSHFVLTQKLKMESGKIADVTVHTALSMFDTLAKAASSSFPSFKPGEILKRGQDYEAENFQVTLTSQRFRDMLEATIGQVIGPKGRMIVFIDDLDRCEGDTAFKLLEALKLYLNTRNCIFVLGLDRHHLEGSVAKALAKEDGSPQRALAREYLGKMFQGFFLLPTPADTCAYLRALLDLKVDEKLRDHLKCFGVHDPLNKDTDLISGLNTILPHNPRKIKAFLSSWRVYLEVVRQQGAPAGDLDWRITLILHYLGQFEEPIYRRLEESPGFYNDHIVAFCRTNRFEDPRFEGLELPYGFRFPSDAGSESEALTPIPAATPASAGGASSATRESKEPEPKKPALPNRTFHIAPLIGAVGSLDPQRLRAHMPRTGA